MIQQQNYEALNGVHLMQTDNNVQPVMGAVHMVRAGDDASRERLDEEFGGMEIVMV